jgi:CBS domain-containing protein
MNIGSICTRDVVMVDAADTLPQAAALMREHHVGALLVVGQTEAGPQAVGVVTDRDLAIEVMARGADGTNIRVAQLVRGRLVTVPAEASLDDAIATIEREGVRRLLVTTGEGRLVGIASLDDMLEALAVQMSSLARAVRAGLAREASRRGPLTAPDIGNIRVPIGHEIPQPRTITP